MCKTYVALFALIIWLPGYSQSSTDIEEDKSRVADMSEQYLKNISTENYDAAYLKLGDGVKPRPLEDSWIKKKKSFNIIAGELESINITEVIVYDNPSFAKIPGIYIFVHFRNEFKDLPVHCGFLAWLKQADSSDDYQIIGDESGSIPKIMYLELTKEKRIELEAEIGCK